jgi:hypothetical protein
MFTHGRKLWLLGALGILGLLVVAGCGSSSKTPPPTANAAAPTKPPRGYVNPKHRPGSPNLIYNYCGVAIESHGNHAIKLTAADKGGHDSWNERPPMDIPADGGQLLIVSQSGFARGCSWHAQWIERDGYIIIKTYDPYDGHNEYACLAGGKYHCYQGVPFSPELPQQLDGNSLRVNYRVQQGVCSTCTPAPKYP